MANNVRRAELHHCAKFCQNRSNGCRSQFFKVAAVHHLGFVCHISGPCTKHTRLRSFNGLFWDILGKPEPEKHNHFGKTSLDLLEQEIVGGSGISWAICKSAPCSRQITMPAPHHSVFYWLDALPAAQPMVSKH